MVSKEVLNAVATWMFMEVGKQTVGAGLGMMGDHLFGQALKGGKSVFTAGKEEVQEYCQDIIGLVSPQKAEEGRATLHHRQRREEGERREMAKEILRNTRSRSTDREYGHRSPHRSSPRPRSRSVGEHDSRHQRVRAEHGDRKNEEHQAKRRRSVDDHHGGRRFERPAHRTRSLDHHSNRHASNGHDISYESRHDKDSVHGSPERHNNHWGLHERHRKDSGVHMRHSRHVGDSYFQQTADRPANPEAARPEPHFLTAKAIRHALQINERDLEAQADFAVQSRTASFVREGRDRVEMLDKLSKHRVWEQSAESNILIINGNDQSYEGGAMSIFSHLIEEKYVHFKHELHIPTIRCYAGCWQRFVGARGPVESMMRNLCWQLLQYPILGISGQSKALGAIKHLELEALCPLFHDLCYAYACLDKRENKQALTILIDGSGIFDMRYEDPKGKHKAFKEAFKAICATVMTLRAMENATVLKILMVFPGRPCDVSEKDGVVHVLTLPKNLGKGGPESVSIPRQ